MMSSKNGRRRSGRIEVIAADLMKAVCERSENHGWKHGLRRHGNEKVERGGVNNCFQDNSYKSREKKNRLVDGRRKTSCQGTVILYFFVLLFPLRWLILRHVHMPKREPEQ